MSDKKCECRFCQDYKRLDELLPQVPEQHRKWLEQFFEWAWNVDEELGLRKCILNGAWPSATEYLENALHKAKALRPAE